jgi:membrane protease YdiL (CAAX protease family)
MNVSEGIRPAAEASLSESRYGFVRRHPILCYYLMAFGFSWTVWIPFYLSQEGLQILPYHLNILWIGSGTFIGPALAAILVTLMTSGRAGLRELFSRVLKWRVGVHWYIISILGLVIVMLITSSLVTGQPISFTPLFTHPDRMGFALLVFFTVQLLEGPLGEEIGWRGFALPRLEQTLGPFRGSLLLGVLWVLWHAPLFFLVPAYSGSKDLQTSLLFMVQFLITVMGINVFMTLIYNRTGSVLMTIFLHAQFNDRSLLFKGLLTQDQIKAGMSYFLLVFLGLALLILLVTLGRQGYQPGRWGVLPQPGSKEKYTVPRARRSVSGSADATSTESFQDRLT